MLPYYWSESVPNNVSLVLESSLLIIQYQLCIRLFAGSLMLLNSQVLYHVYMRFKTVWCVRTCVHFIWIGPKSKSRANATFLQHVIILGRGVLHLNFLKHVNTLGRGDQQLNFFTYVNTLGRDALQLNLFSRALRECSRSSTVFIVYGFRR